MGTTGNEALEKLGLKIKIIKYLEEIVTYIGEVE